MLPTGVPNVAREIKKILKMILQKKIERLKRFFLKKKSKFYLSNVTPRASLNFLANLVKPFEIIDKEKTRSA